MKASVIVHLLPQPVAAVPGSTVRFAARSFSMPSVNETASWQRPSVSVSLRLFSWKMRSGAKKHVDVL